jgi:hypothetical protein
MDRFQVGDDVAILPSPNATAQDTTEIVRVKHVGPILVTLADDRSYFRADGRYVDRPQEGIIVPAMNEHRLAMERKRREAIHTTGIDGRLHHTTT